MAPKFGTSGLRGLVTELTPDLVADYARAFLAACPVGSGLWVGRDLRDSSADLAEVVIETARGEGVSVVDCGAVPTPALAMAAMADGSAAIMVTGSHIPADRNGLKFYVPGGEIDKADEGAILAALGRAPQGLSASRRFNGEVGGDWAARYRAAFGRALEGLNVGVWAHSAVSRDLLITTLEAMGARVAQFGRSDIFIPVDTEAVPADVRKSLVEWSAGLDAIVSTDGDGDRPLVADATGQIVPGDVLGQIAARHLRAHTVVTTISANTGIEKGRFDVRRTRIGSPFIIAEMAKCTDRVVGYEPNGGFLLGFEATLAAGTLAPLMTRDSLLPILTALIEGKAAGSLAERVAQEPARFTATDRLEGVDQARSGALLQRIGADDAALAAFVASIGVVTGIDRTDGLRVTLAGGDILHLRPSGNAPEFRVYAEAASVEDAAALLTKTFALVAAELA